MKHNGNDFLVDRFRAHSANDMARDARPAAAAPTDNRLRGGVAPRGARDAPLLPVDIGNSTPLAMKNVAGRSGTQRGVALDHVRDRHVK
jgi:hypothetical protein